MVVRRQFSKCRIRCFVMEWMDSEAFLSATACNLRTRFTEQEGSCFNSVDSCS